MDVYFIRHGETDGNVARRHQHPDTSLNETGKAQVAVVAKALATLSPTHLVTSTNVRAIETARAIGVVCDLIPETNPVFEEFHRPQHLIGQRYVSVATAHYIWRWFRGQSIEIGGESYPEFIARVVAARTYLEALPADARVVVVSHAVFTNIFLEHVCQDRPMGLLEAVYRFVKVLRIKNTAIIKLTYTKHVGTCGWVQVRK